MVILEHKTYQMWNKLLLANEAHNKCIVSICCADIDIDFMMKCGVCVRECVSGRKNLQHKIAQNNYIYIYKTEKHMHYTCML